jgi:hypothetical protein
VAAWRACQPRAQPATSGPRWQPARPSAPPCPPRAPSRAGLQRSTGEIGQPRDTVRPLVSFKQNKDPQDSLRRRRACGGLRRPSGTLRTEPSSCVTVGHVSKAAREGQTQTQTHRHTHTHTQTHKHTDTDTNTQTQTQTQTHGHRHTDTDTDTDKQHTSRGEGVDGTAVGALARGPAMGSQRQERRRANFRAVARQSKQSAHMSGVAPMPSSGPGVGLRSSVSAAAHVSRCNNSAPQQYYHTGAPTHPVRWLLRQARGQQSAA